MVKILELLKHNRCLRAIYVMVSNIRSAGKYRIIGKRIYAANLREYRQKWNNSLPKASGNFVYLKNYTQPCYFDRFADNGNLDQYFWQDLWAAKLVAEKNPQKHYDIGSSVGGFIAHLASFRENIHLVDIRPMKGEIPGVSFVQADATNLSNIRDESIESVSALCSIEHFGLGRYGDQVDTEAWLKVIKSIIRVVKKGGYAYISVPVGWEHLEFDAHRVFYASTIIHAFEPMKLIEFSCVGPDGNGIERNVPIHKYDNCTEHSLLRFGLFCFIKE